MAERYWDNPNFAEYESLLRRLHCLMAAGKGDTDEADAVRDDMDKPWRQLGREELARLDGLSADLYMLEDNEIFEPADTDEETHGRLQAELREAWSQEKWEDVLSLLRKDRTFGPPDRVAYLRAKAYERLGHLNSSLMFMEYAARQRPDDVTYRWSVMELLFEVKRFDEAVTLAEMQIERSTREPGLLIQAASILLRAAKERPGNQNRAIFEQAIDVLEGALQASSRLLPAVVVFGYLTLGFCYEALKQWPLARNAYDRALQVRPDDPTVLAARGLLLMRLDPPSAISDFRLAVERGTVPIAPYLYVAHDALVRGDYAHCLDLCIRILSLTQRPRVLAAALQWAAIAQLELGGSPEVARQNFERALDLDPLNEQIRTNLEQFEHWEQSGATTGDRKGHWPAIAVLDPTLIPPADPSYPFVPVAA
jgi:tetratricopeptide (TPR) repeat protein